MKKVTRVFQMIAFPVACFLMMCFLLSGVSLTAPKDWKLGVALYSFNAFSFPEQLDKADSAELKYIEGFTFGRAGAELKDSMIMRLSPAGVEKMKELIAKKGLHMESMYVVGGKTIDAWAKEFSIAKLLGVKHVVGEPPINMWDSVDSLAGAYGIKLAIHEHWRGMSAYWHPDSVLAALKGHKNFGACADLGHWPKSGINPVEGLKKLAGHIMEIHLKDCAEYNNPKIQDVEVGKGVLNLPEVVKELKRQNFNGYIIIERDTQEKPSNLETVKNTVKFYNETIKAN